MSKIEVNAIEPQCGTTLTLGANNDTVVLGTGAAFGGGVGAVKWETTPQTGSFQATAGRGYFMNTTSGALTVTTPASPTAGDIFAVSDYARTFQTNNLTVAPHSGAKIGGVAANATLSTEGQTATFVYVDSTEGWINTQETSNSVAGRNFITATGGTITTSGNCKIHTFTGPGTFCVSQISSCVPENTISYLVIAGGGGGGKHQAGGGGAGGYRELKSPTTPFTASPLDGYPSSPNRITLTTTSYPITVGAGGGPGTSTCNGFGVSGGVSTFSTITSAGGGGGGGYQNTPNGGLGQNGGSGGGGSSSSQPGGGLSNGGTGNTPHVTPPQGNNGGGGFTPSPHSGGGGGGAGGVGGSITAPGCNGGAGGAGVTSEITASPVARGGGGGGSAGNGPAGGGATAGGGAGSTNPNATPGTANTGGGGGGSGDSNANGGNGGSGIVVIRYKFQ